MTNNNNSESSTVLPDDLMIYDILTRVPIESVVRFTCVCKLWSKNLLNDKRFAILHQKNSPYSSPPGIIDSKLDKNTHQYYISLFDVDKNQKKIIRFRPETDYHRLSYMNIKQSFNGLLLIHRRKYCYYDYIVYNAITGRSVNLPIPVGLGFWDCEIRLAYDPVGENYKAVCFGGRADENFCKILTLGEFGRDSWRNLVKPGFRYFNVKPGFRFNNPSLRNAIVFWNGVLYWISTEDPKTVKKALYSVDISTETLYATKLPNEASLSAECDLVKMGGLVCYYEFNRVYKQLKLWVLKKNIDNQYEWVRGSKNELERSFRNIDLQYNCVIEIVTNPKLKIIFRRCLRVYEQDWKGQLIRTSKFEYYSCDVELNKIELILSSNIGSKGEWHVNSIAYI